MPLTPTFTLFFNASGQSSGQAIGNPTARACSRSRGRCFQWSAVLAVQPSSARCCPTERDIVKRMHPKSHIVGWDQSLRHNVTQCPTMSAVALSAISGNRLHRFAAGILTRWNPGNLGWDAGNVVGWAEKTRHRAAEAKTRGGHPFWKHPLLDGLSWRVYTIT